MTGWTVTSQEIRSNAFPLFHGSVRWGDHRVGRYCYYVYKRACRVKRFRDGTSQSDRKRFWRWLHDRFASAVEQDTHWRLMYDVTPTRKRQHTQGHASSPTCLFCGNDAAVIETVSHYFFECAYSTSFWGGVLRILFDKLGIEDTDVDPSTFTPEQLTMGLPLLRGRGRMTSRCVATRTKRYSTTQLRDTRVR
ncbi:BQ5605_C006g04231 [Microbotryum silenes-dioicae]|uniref:BQ5605_C006g04231 protein n=1 Tax=Microbotryum silenes-dioicae TaxID=796604 RepID=A0A2X0P8X5_9BASI|nr:BQ5605_C006g04231 [Microbotryum silenes-dioicae]